MLSLLLEGGSELNGAFLARTWLDRVVLFCAQAAWGRFDAVCRGRDGSAVQ